MKVWNDSRLSVFSRAFCNCSPTTFSKTFPQILLSQVMVSLPLPRTLLPPHEPAHPSLPCRISPTRRGRGPNCKWLRWYCRRSYPLPQDSWYQTHEARQTTAISSASFQLASGFEITPRSLGILPETDLEATFDNNWCFQTRNMKSFVSVIVTYCILFLKPRSSRKGHGQHNKYTVVDKRCSISEMKASSISVFYGRA